MLAYLAEPIDWDTGNDRMDEGFRDMIVSQIKLAGWAAFRPAKGFTASIDTDTMTAIQIENINRSVLAGADAMVARLPYGVPSHGVPMEIEYAARTLGIPVFVLGEMGIALRACPNVIEADINDLPGRLKGITGRPVQLSSVAIRHEGFIRERSYPGDAGLDLTCTEAVTVQPGRHENIPTGVRIELPEGTFGWVVARSSTYKTHGLMILPGIIDEEYTGPYFATAFNPGSDPVDIEPGDRIAQVLVLPNLLRGAQLIKVNQIEDRIRGANGFGSTGRGLSSNGET